MYCDFVPIFVRAWKKLYPKIHIKIVLISDSIPDQLKDYSRYLICFPPLDNISTAFTAQYIRLLYPCLIDCQGGIMITDIDMIPMNSRYYTENIAHLDDDKFVYLRDVLLNDRQIAMCYNVATKQIWRDIFQVDSLETLIEKLTVAYHEIKYDGQPGKSGWFSDQTALYRHVHAWHQKTNNFVHLRDSVTGFQRLDRLKIKGIGYIDLVADKIKNGYYSDYHCCRPYSQNRELNEKVMDLLPTSDSHMPREQIENNRINRSKGHPLVLLIPFYHITDQYRFLELKSCFLQNLKLFDQLVVFFENYDPDQTDYHFLVNEKTKVINVSQWHTYDMMFGYANEHLLNSICVISNTDILFDGSISRTEELSFHDKKLYALTRWEEMEPNKFGLTLQKDQQNAFSFDSYIFKSPIDAPLIEGSGLSIKFGYAGCDNLLVKRLQFDHLFDIANPCLDIKTYHIDHQTRDRSIQTVNSYWKVSDYPWPNKSFKFRHNLVTTPMNGIPVTYIDQNTVIDPTPDKIRISKKKRVISFSLYGDKKHYIIGAFRNAEDAVDLYPGWECWFYVDTESVNRDVIQKLSEYPHVRVIEKRMSQSPKARMWRFEAIDSPEVELMISRDTDTKILKREQLAVEEWIQSGRLFHIMRDHPDHGCNFIFAGMFGTKKIPYLNWSHLIEKYGNLDFAYDQHFLDKFIYSQIVHSVVIHSTFHVFPGEKVRPFPIEYDESYDFVGGYYYENDDRSEPHLQKLKEVYNRLKNYRVPGYQFYYNLDSIGNDISRSENRDIQKMVDQCDQLPNANAFNTLGFIKCDVDPKKLVKSPYFGVMDGIFVRI
jgi:hypothetical protein